MTLEGLVQRAEDRGWRLQYQSPFDRGHDHFIGLTKSGCSGWNGRPDLERHAPSLAEAVELAAKVLEDYAPGDLDEYHPQAADLREVK